MVRSDELSIPAAIPLFRISCRTHCDNLSRFRRAHQWDMNLSPISLDDTTNVLRRSIFQGWCPEGGGGGGAGEHLWGFFEESLKRAGWHTPGLRAGLAIIHHLHCFVRNPLPSREVSAAPDAPPKPWSRTRAPSDSAERINVPRKRPAQANNPRKAGHREALQLRKVRW